MWVAFALQKLLTFFRKKFQHICVSLDVNFNESLTNDVVSFEQLGPEFLAKIPRLQLHNKTVSLDIFIYCRFCLLFNRHYRAESKA